MCNDTERENGGSINFIFTLLPSPTLDKTYRLLPCSSQENAAAYDVLINSNFLWMANSLKVSTFACFGPISFVSHMYVCVRQVLLFNCNIAIATYIWEFLLYEHNGGALYSGMPTLTFCAWLDSIYCFHIICSLSDHECSYSQVTDHVGFVCALSLGYAVCIFHTTDTKYLMFHITDANH